MEGIGIVVGQYKWRVTIGECWQIKGKRREIFNKSPIKRLLYSLLYWQKGRLLINAVETTKTYSLIDFM